MFFLTTDECLHYAEAQGFVVDKEGNKLVRKTEAVNAISFDLEDAKVCYYNIATSIISWLPESSSLLLWINEFGIWPHSENLHLYYKLRQSYKDYRHIREAPGHCFLNHEKSDLVSFLHLTLMFGWGGYLFNGSQSYIIFSHDGWIAFESTSKLDKQIKDIQGFKIPYRLFEQ